MITFRYILIFSSVSVKFGESESSLVDPDKSLVEGMLISFHTEKNGHRCNNETTVTTLLAVIHILDRDISKCET